MPESESTHPAELPPQPAPSLDSQPFWDRLAQGELAIQRCSQCRGWQFPLIPRCRHCDGGLVMEKLSGDASVYTFVIEHRRVAPGFDHLLPYAIGLVTPTEAPAVRIPARMRMLIPHEYTLG